MTLPTVYIGYDQREQAAYDVLEASILDHASGPVNILPLDQKELRKAGLYTRASYNVGPQSFDSIDEKPFSTDFSFSRFLVPTLNQHKGKALFMDCDMFVRHDILELWDTCVGNKAIWCVPHNYTPDEGTKMYGVAQQPYSMKNWSSFMMFDCSHFGNQHLSVYDVSNQTGRWLHNFKWLDRAYGARKFSFIGEIDEEWNWLDAHSYEYMEPKNVHFTTGGPWFSSWTPLRPMDAVYANDWDERYVELLIERSS